MAFVRQMREGSGEGLLRLVVLWGVREHGHGQLAQQFGVGGQGLAGAGIGVVGEQQPGGGVGGAQPGLVDTAVGARQGAPGRIGDGDQPPDFVVGGFGVVEPQAVAAHQPVGAGQDEGCGGVEGQPESEQMGLAAGGSYRQGRPCSTGAEQHARGEQKQERGREGADAVATVEAPHALPVGREIAGVAGP